MAADPRPAGRPRVGSGPWLAGRGGGWAGYGRGCGRGDVGDRSRLGHHDHMRALDFGDGGAGALGHGPDHVGAGALSGDASTVQDGSDFQAGGPDGSENASSETGRWVAAITAACWVGRSAANTSWNLVGSIANSVAVPAPSGVGYCSATCAVERMLSLEPAVTSARRSPSSGANAATKTRPTTLPSPVAALEITAPPLEWPTARTGPGTCLMKLAT